MADHIFKRILEYAKKMTDDGWFYVTDSRELVKNEDVEALLKEAKQKHGWSSKISDLTTFVREHAPQLFTMLVYKEQEKLIDQFYHKGMDDSAFPVNLVEDKESIQSTKDIHKNLRLGFPLTQSVYEWQWKFFVPELQWTAFNHTALSSKTTMPYIKPLRMINSTDFSVVFQGLVHRDHISLELDGIEIATDEGHPLVAVKQLLPTRMTKKESETFIQAEYQTLDTLRDYETAHLIKAIAFYRKVGLTGDELNFVFPWAQHGNLRQFWTEKVPSVHDNRYMKWIFTQLVGLADAIRTLHHENQQTCRHGDLKPENVLCFNTSKSTDGKDQTSCIFVISDVGLSRTYDQSTAFRTHSKLTKGETIAYAAPETALFPNLPTSRRYDIWSLGCLYLEFVIWLLYGTQGLTQFAEEIGVREKGRFYILTSSANLNVTGAGTAEVSPAVEKWIKIIKQDPRCAGSGSNSTAISRLIALVETRLLVINASPDKEEAKTISKTQLGVDMDEGQGPVKFILQRPTTLNEQSQNHIRSQLEKFESRKDERAYALEVCGELVKIKTDADTGNIKWINLQEEQGTGSDIGPIASANLPSSTHASGPVGMNQDVIEK